MIRCFTIPLPRRPLLVMVTSSRHGFSLGWGLRPRPRPPARMAKTWGWTP